MSLINRIIAKRLSRFLPPRYEKLVTLDRLFHSKDFPDVVLFGDSVMERTAQQDTDPNDLGKMITEELQQNGLSCLIVAHSAYHMLVYYGFILAMQRMGRFPRVIVLPVNMRSFSPQWDLQPYWQFDEEIRILNKYYETHGKKIERLQKKTHEDISAVETMTFRNTPVNYPLSELKSIGQFVDVIEAVPQDQNEIFERKREIFVFHYTHPLAPNHRKVVALDKILNLLAQNKVKVFVYTIPVNYKAGERFVGTTLKAQLDKNAQVLRCLVDSHARQGLKFLDWNCLFDSSYFLSEDLATEHINQYGRRELSHRIVKEIITLLEMKD